MRENLAKEKELLEQLEEANATDRQEADPKAKGKGAKGGVAKTPEEIKAEIEQLLSVEMSGWVLMDFPRTINQAKLLENVLTGFKSLTDLPKSKERTNFEVWSKFADPLTSPEDKLTNEIQP